MDTSPFPSRGDITPAWLAILYNLQLGSTYTYSSEGQLIRYLHRSGSQNTHGKFPSFDVACRDQFFMKMLSFAEKNPKLPYSNHVKVASRPKSATITLRLAEPLKPSCGYKPTPSETRENRADSEGTMVLEGKWSLNPTISTESRARTRVRHSSWNHHPHLVLLLRLRFWKF